MLNGATDAAHKHDALPDGSSGEKSSGDGSGSTTTTIETSGSTSSGDGGSDNVSNGPSSGIGSSSSSSREPTVLCEGTLKLERPPSLGGSAKHSGVFKERHFHLVLPPPPPLEAFLPGAPFLPAAAVYPALVYAKESAKPHKADAQHCCLLATEAAACAEDAGSDPQGKRLRVGGRWTLEAPDPSVAAAWLGSLRRAVADRQALVRARQAEARAVAEAALRAPLTPAHTRPALHSQSTFS